MRQKRKSLMPIARTLRRRSTEPERILWRHLRARRLDFKFRRQVPLEGCVVDFVCFEKKVIVELDGSGHASPSGMAADALRDHALEAAGFRVLRIWNYRIYRELPTVLEQIYDACASSETSSFIKKEETEAATPCKETRF
ncbi:endonuclease domain-containing protein [Rhodocaloribacter sp.]